MATLSGNKIKDTYQSLIKLTDNGNLTTGAKQLTDGFGNNSPLYISTTQIGIGVTPEATYDLHVYSNAKVGGNLTVTGDLTVEGTTTTIDTQTLTVEDPLIEVASNNTSTDAVDIGWYGKYAPSGTVLYAGLFRDTGDSKFKLFRNLEEQPTTTVNTSGTGYTKATLVIGGLEATTGDFTDTVTVDGAIEVENSSGFGRIEIGGSSGGYIDLKSPFSDDFDLRLYTAGTNAQINAINGELDITAYTNINLQYQGTDVLVMSSTGVAVTGTGSFTGQVTIPATPSASTDAASKGYVDSQVGANNELSEVLANGNTTGGTDIAVSAGDDITFTDTSEALFGTGNDLKIYHNGSTSDIWNYTGDLRIRNNSNDSNIDISASDEAGTGSQVYIRANGSTGAAELFHYSYKKFETTSTGVSVTGGASFTDNIDINGNNKHIRWVDTYGNWLIEVGDGANNFKIHSQSLAADYLTLEGGGQLNLGEYGSGSFTGTATYRLAVDSSGDVIEIPIGGGAVDGSGTANTVTMWSDTDTITNAPITISGNNATFAGKILVGTGATAAASLNAYTQTVSTNLYSALRIIENSGASSYWDIGATGGGLPDLNFYVNAGTTPKLTIDGSGNVGIGVTPESWGTSGDTQVIRISTMTSLSEAFTGTQLASNFYFDGTNDKYILSDFASSLLQIDGEFRFRNASSGTAGANITWNERMRIDSTGDIGLGVTDGDIFGRFYGRSVGIGGTGVAKLQINGTSYSGIDLGQSGTRYAEINASSSELGLNTISNIPMIFRTGASATERMRITSGGDVLIGKQSLSAASVGFEVEANGIARITKSGDTTLLLNRLSNDGVLVDFRKDTVQVGTISTNGNSLPSDRDFKKDITDLELGLDFVNTLNTKKYRYKISDDNSPLLYGIIAQDLEQSLLDFGVNQNEAVLLQSKEKESEQDSAYSLDYLKLIPVLINAIQELKADNDSLRARIEILENN